VARPQPHDNPLLDLERPKKRHLFTVGSFEGGRGPEGAELLDDRILVSFKVFTFRPVASSRTVRMFIIPRPLAILCFRALTHFLFAPGEIVTRVFIQLSRTPCTRQSGWGEVG